MIAQLLARHQPDLIPPPYPVRVGLSIVVIGIGLFAIWEARDNQKKGFGKAERKPTLFYEWVYRDKNPWVFIYMVMAKYIIGLGCIGFGIYLVLNA